MNFVSKILIALYRSAFVKRILVAGGSLLGIFVLMNYIVLPLYVNHAGRIAVPSVIGMQKDDAIRLLESSGFRAVEADTRPDPEHPIGVVIQQNPPANAVVKEGRRIYLSLSGGEIQVPVPSLRGRSLRDARFALERQGLKLGTVGFNSSDSYPENTIIEQSIAPDSRVSKGTEVHITVSQGRLLGVTHAPLIIGKTLGEARTILESDGFRLGVITYQQSFDLVPNTVVDQYPRPGDVLGPGQAIDLFVVKTGRPAEEFQTPPH